VGLAGDISPENVVVGPQGGVTLIDFGMSLKVPQASSGEGKVLIESRPKRGKSQYMVRPLATPLDTGPFRLSRRD
jgi:serine/threonine protein kinase